MLLYSRRPSSRPSLFPTTLPSRGVAHQHMSNNAAAATQFRQILKMDPKYAKGDDEFGASVRPLRRESPAGVQQACSLA